MNQVLQAAAELQAVCAAQNWRYSFIGGLAVLRWGEPRETIDADLTLLTGFGGEEPFIQNLLEHFQPRIPDAERFALENRVLLLRSQSGVGLDISFGALPFEELVVNRSTDFAYSPETSLCTCSAEDLIVLKSFAGRGQDWVDVERIIARQTGKLDWTYILHHLKALADLKDEPDIMNELERRRVEYER